MFLGMFVFVLLVLALACASVANLLLVRATSRTEEIAVRAALGAGRSRLITQHLIEAFLLSSTGAVLGVVAAQVGLTWFSSFVQIDMIPFWIELGMSPAAAVFAAVAAFGAAMVAGVVPAIKATGVDMHSVLKGTQGSSSRVRFGSISSALTIAEVTLSIAFLAGAALAAESLRVAGNLDRKLPTKQVLVAEIALVDEVGTDETGKPIVPEGSIPPAQWATVQEAIRAATERLPGARVAVLANCLPGTQHSRSRVELEKDAADNPAAGIRVPVASVSPEFFEAFEAVLLAGRSFDPADTLDSELVAIVNRSFTRRFFGVESPLGERFRLEPGSGNSDWIRIIGVIDDLRMNPGGDNKAGLYLPFAQKRTNRFALAVRLDNDPLAMSAAMKETIKRVDSRIDVAGIQTLEQWIEGYLVSYKTMSLMFTALGAAAFFLALAGLYAVMAFSVVQRTREIGIRLALGADRRRVLGAVLRRGLMQIVTGIALGSAMGWALLRLMQLIPIDMASGGTGWLAVVATAMLVAGFVACLVPASRALGIHPVEALRHE
jgi:predicted permease